MRTSRNGTLFIAAREALVLVAYQDGPHMSVGFGHNNPKLRPGDTVTVKSAFRMLKADIADRESSLAKYLKVEVSQNEWDALMSLHYQSGNRYLPKIAALINEGKKQEAADALLQCDASLDGTRMKGLAKRRAMERTLFLDGKYGDLSTVPFWKGDPRTTKRQEYEVKAEDL